MKNDARMASPVPGCAVALVLAIFAAASPPAAAQIPASAFANKNLTTAEAQRLVYDDLLRQGLPPEIAALSTMATQIVLEEPDHIQIVQTMFGGLRREVDIRLTPGRPEDRLRMPIMLDDGSLMLADELAMRDTGAGYETSGTVYLPDAQPSAALLERWRGRDSPWWTELLGIETAHAQGGVVGVVMSFGDSVVGGAGNAIGVPDMTVSRVVELTRQVTSDPGVEATRTVGRVATDITEAMETQTPPTPWGQRASTAAAIAKAGWDLYQLFKKDGARRDQLSALQDCADNPTQETARRARTEDPNYERATTEAITDARRNLTMNTTISAFATVANTVAQQLIARDNPAIAPATSKGVGYLNSVEGKMLQHVADEHIMKNAGKGVVPCTPACGPVYAPAPTPAPEPIANQPPAEWSCNSAVQSLACEPRQLTSRPDFARTELPRPESLTCGPLRVAHFEFHKNVTTGGCEGSTCETQTEQAQFVGTAALEVNGTQGYLGVTTGEYASSTERVLRSPVQCGTYESSSSVQGRAGMEVNAFNSINNPVTGGLDTSAMPPDTSVIEVLVEGYGLRGQGREKNGCDAPQVGPTRGDVGPLGCYFYGLSLQRPGYFIAYVNGDPAAGTCTLSLSR